jgi:hypothetical protein
MVLRAIKAGQLPGVAVPKDAPSIPSDLTPDDITDACVGIYRPATEGLALVLFNQQSVTLEQIKQLDQAGTLSDSFPSITDFLDGATGAGEPEPETNSTAPVHILPQPSGGGSDLADARIKKLAGTTQPSKHALPGAGQILNGLLQRPI